VSTAPAPNVAQRPPAGAGPPAQWHEQCPLCRAPLAYDQDWCLHCGAAARTRVATSPNWRAPLAALAGVLALSLGVLAAALIALAGDSGSTTSATRTALTTVSAPATITQPGAATTTAPAGALPGTSNSSGGTPPGTTSTHGTGGATGTTATTPATAPPGKSKAEAEAERLRQSGKTPTIPKLKLPETKVPKIKVPHFKVPKINLPKLTPGA